MISNYSIRATTVVMALLGATLVAVLTASGTALAVEKENGLIYYSVDNRIYSIDPAASNSQPTFESYGATFDISPDRTTLVYGEVKWFLGHVGPFYLFPLVGDPDNPDDPYDSHDVTELQITNTRDDTNDPIEMRSPKFSLDGQTIYFTGKQVLTSDTDDEYHLYSVPTEGGEATRIPINEGGNDSLNFAESFALSHDGSTLAFGGSGGVYTAPVGGGDVTRITSDGCKSTSYSHPSFSPDDQTIVYKAMIFTEDNCSGTGHETIYTIPVNNDGTTAGTPLFPEDATDAYPSYVPGKYHPAFSPDGKSIAFANWLPNPDRPDSTAGYKLAIAPATGGSVTNIADCTFCYPLWVEKDTIPPDTTITDGPDEGSTADTDSATFEFSANESVYKFQCRLDSDSTSEADWSDCSSPKTYSGLSNGSYTFKVRAGDEAGNYDDSPASRTWIVSKPDITAPTGEVSINGGAAYTYSSTVQLSLFAKDNEGGSGVKSMHFSNDGTNWSEWEDYAASKASWTLSAGAGTKTVYVEFRDVAGNVSAKASDTINKYNPPIKKKKKKKKGR